MGTSTIPVRWRFFSVIFILSFLSYLLRQHFPVAGEFMMKELAISELQMGWVYGAFFWGYLVFQIPGGILGKRFGPRLTLLVAGVIWVLACLLFALLPGSFESSVVGAVGLLIAIRVVMGAAHAPIYPVQAASVERWFPVGQWALPNAVSSTGLSLGAAAAAPIFHCDSQLRLARLVSCLRASGNIILLDLVVVCARQPQRTSGYVQG